MVRGRPTREKKQTKEEIFDDGFFSAQMVPTGRVGVRCGGEDDDAEGLASIEKEE